MKNIRGWITVIFIMALSIAMLSTLSACATKDPRPDHIEIEGPTEPPAGWIDFCKRNPKDCAP